MFFVLLGLKLPLILGKKKLSRMCVEIQCSYVKQYGIAVLHVEISSLLD